MTRQPADFKARVRRPCSVTLRLTPEECEYIARRAERDLLSRPDWMRKQLLAGSGLWP